MNQPSSFCNKKSNSAFNAWMIAAILLVCVMLTSSVVGATLELFVYVVEPDTVVSILPPDENSTDINKSGSADTLSVQSKATLTVNALSVCGGNQPSSVTLAKSSPSFFVSDDKRVWGNNTDIDIFRASYANGSGKIIASGKNGDKIIAPGTSNTYLFHLTNDGNVAINYEMNVFASLSDNLKSYTVPVKVRLSDETGAWLCGNADTWEDFTDLNGVNKKAVLGADSYSACYLEWEWPFDSDDSSFDTLLGNLASNEELVLTVNIDITAEYSPDPDSQGGMLQTGNNTHMELWILLMILSFAVLTVTLVISRRKRSNCEV